MVVPKTSKFTLSLSLQRRLLNGGRFCFADMNKKRLRVFLRVRHGEIVCICLRSHRMCYDKTCERDVVEYDQYQHLKECFKNKPNE